MSSIDKKLGEMAVAAGAVKKGGKQELMGSKVFVRIRPFGTDGHFKGGAESDKTIAGFDERAVKVRDRDTTTTFDFADRVFLPTDTNSHACDEMLDNGLLEAFWGNRNVHFFAYGQTGTGKSHTMYGPSGVIGTGGGDSPPHPDWGLMPRVIDRTLKHLEGSKGRLRGALYASAVEFICGFPFDLNTPGAPMCQVNVKGQLRGNKLTRLTSPHDFLPFLKGVWASRQTRNNGVNLISSRSHVAINLTLMLLDTATNKYKRTFFSLVDLAGAERDRHTDGEAFDMSVFYVKLMRFAKGDGNYADWTVKEQNRFIQWDLLAILQQINQATEAHKKGRAYNPPTQVSTDTVNYLLGACDGQAQIAMCVCLSQAPQYGFEQWESLVYGSRMAKLRVPIRGVPEARASAALKGAQKELVDAEADLKQALSKGAANAQMNQRYNRMRQQRAFEARQVLEALRELCAEAGGE